MENKAIKILSVCLVALFVLAVLFFAVGLILEYKKAPGVIDSTLSQFISDVGVASEYYTPGTQQFSDVLRARIASNKTIAVVTIAQDSNVIFAYPLSSPFITQGAAGQPTITAASSFAKVRSSQVELGADDYVVTSVLYSLQPAVIYSYIRISFLVILAGTLVAGIALMYLYLTEQKKDGGTGFDDAGTAEKLRNSKLDFPQVSSRDSIGALVDDEFDLPDEEEMPYLDEGDLPEGAMDFPPAEESGPGAGPMNPQEEGPDGREAMPPAGPQPAGEAPARQEAPPPPPAEVDLTELVYNDFGVDDLDALDESLGLSQEPQAADELEEAVVAQAKAAQEESPEPAAPRTDEDDGFNIDRALQGYEPPPKDSAPAGPTAAPAAAEGTAAEPAEPAGLFSPVTGFGWEAYLEERLDSELIRSASSEEDIGLMIVRIQGLDRADERSRAIYDKLLEFYKFRDLIFEYGTDGFSCIVHSINVDGALDMAERVYVALSKVMEENGMDNEIGIGISTRSFRLVPGKRILTEAEQALLHAFEDPETAIVAFRVDPEKYRKYISEYTDGQE